MTAFTERDSSFQTSVMTSDLQAEIARLQAMIVQSRQSITRADVLIDLLRTRYGLDDHIPAQVRSAD